MRKILLFAAAALLLGCTSFDEEVTPLQQLNDSQELTVPGTDPYSLQIMRQAVDEVAATTRSSMQVCGDAIQATHLYVRFDVLNQEQAEAVQNIDLAAQSILPLDQYSSVSKEESIYEPKPEDQGKIYAIVPADTEFPEGVAYEVLKELYNPALAAEGESNSEWAEQVMMRAREIAQPKQTRAVAWRPKGRISVYDDVKQGYVDLEGIEVQLVNPAALLDTVKLHTNSLGKFDLGKNTTIAYNVYFSFSNPKWDIYISGIDNPVVIGPVTDDTEISMNINNNSIYYGPAVVYRAVRRYMYLSDLYTPDCSKISQAYIDDQREEWIKTYGSDRGFHFRKKLALYCKNEVSDGDNGALGHGSINYATIAWKNLKTQKIFEVASHELGHVALFIKSSNTNITPTLFIMESWSTFTGFYMMELEYTALGIYDKVYRKFYDSSLGKYVMEPFGVSEQEWIAPSNGNNNNRNRKYTPFFVDIYDDYNQYDYFIKYQDGRGTDRMPNDNVCIRDAKKIEQMAYEVKDKYELITRTMSMIYRAYPGEDSSRAWNLVEPYVNCEFIE